MSQIFDEHLITLLEGSGLDPEEFIETPSMDSSLVQAFDFVRLSLIPTVGASASFSRSSTADYVDAEGVTQTAAVNVPRFTHSATKKGKFLGFMAGPLDQCTFATSGITGLSTTQGSVVVDVVAPASNGSDGYYWSLHDGTSSNFIAIYRNTTGNAIATVKTAGVTQVSMDLGAWAVNKRAIISFAWKANDFAAVLNENAIVTDTTGTIPSFTTVTVGGLVTGSQPDGTMHKVYMYNVRKSNQWLINNARRRLITS